MSAIHCLRCVPRRAVRRCDRLGAKIVPVQCDLNTDDADVVGRCRGHDRRSAGATAPSIGCDMDAVGGVVSLNVAKLCTAEPVTLPAASLEFTWYA